jgi:phosphatidylserine/phosphatidylglycerophosphate/cardiolipin synthase-like enzyme
VLVLLGTIAALVWSPAGFAGASTSSPGLSLITEPNAGMAPIDRLLAGATHSVDLTMYEFSDPATEKVLATDAARGVTVRVLLDQHHEQSANEAAFSYLEHHGVEVRWAPARFDLTHEKAAVIDDRVALVMTINFTAQYYATTRDFAIVDTEPADVQAIESVFASDWSNRSVTPPSGDDLVWSPGSEAAIVSVIDGAHHTLVVENEEMDDRYVTTPLEAAARRGVDVEIVMTNSSEWSSAFGQLAAAGVHIRTYAPNASRYIHAKAIVADAGYSDAEVFVGSQNFSIASLVYNRELGIVTSSPAIVHGIDSVMQGDFAQAARWS